MIKKLDVSVQMDEKTQGVFLWRRSQGTVRQIKITREHVVLTGASVFSSITWVFFALWSYQSPIVARNQAKASPSLSEKEIPQPLAAGSQLSRIAQPNIFDHGVDKVLSMRVTALSPAADSGVRLWGLSEWRDQSGIVRWVPSSPELKWDAKGRVISGKGGQTLFADVATPVQLVFRAPDQTSQLTAVMTGLSQADGSSPKELARILPKVDP